MPSASASGSAAPPVASAAAAAVPALPGGPELTKDGLYSFTSGGLELVVDPHDASVVRLSLNGKSALFPRETNVDGDTFHAEVDGGSLLLKDADGSAVKRFRLDTARRSVEVTYTLKNVSPTPVHVGALDSYRVPARGGLTFFPGAQNSGSSLKLDTWQSVVWFPHDQNQTPALLEARCTVTEGWIATASEGLVIVKIFDESTNPSVVINAAYDASNKHHTWVGIAEQPRSPELAPGASVTSHVRLLLRRLPPTIATKPGNQELVGFVRGVIQ